MERFIGTKEILARPMNRLEYNQYRGWELLADENGADEGFLVEYIDGGQANHPDHKGYISWSPREVFERAYRPNGNFLQRLHIEYDELQEKLGKLRVFLESPKVLDLNERNRSLLEEQETAMTQYAIALGSRIQLLEAE